VLLAIPVKIGSSKKVGLKEKKGKAKLLVTGSNLICPFGGYMFVEKKKIGLFAPSGLPVNRPTDLEKYTVRHTLLRLTSAYLSILREMFFFDGAVFDLKYI
jgi:hypothetical protein